MERYQQLFTRLQASKEGAFVPFGAFDEAMPGPLALYTVTN